MSMEPSEDPRVYARQMLMRMTFRAIRARRLSMDEWDRTVREFFPHLLDAVGESGLVAMMVLAKDGIRGERRNKKSQRIRGLW